MSGQAGARGYLVQSLICVLNSIDDQQWHSLIVEPNLSSDKVDVIWYYPNRTKVVQIKHSQNQINWGMVKTWAEELEKSIQVEEYELKLIGPCNKDVASRESCSKVSIPKPHELNFTALIEQAAHKLDKYLESKNILKFTPKQRELIIEALTTKLSVYSTAGSKVSREDFDKLLVDWAKEAAGQIHSMADILPNTVELEKFIKRSEKLFLAPPRPTYNLIGRDELLSNFKQQLFTAKTVALNGLPGVGKTALAVELAHDTEVLKQFPDGVLWAGLGRQPDVTMHLSTWAVALGIPQAEVAKLASVGVEAWAKAIHTAIGMRRMLLIVDDAWQAEAALAFKLGGPNCAHLVTTRLPGIALDFAGEYAIAVKELSEDKGLTLLAQLASRVVEAEPEEAKALVKAVGGLPLGLILMGKYLRQETHSGQPRRLHRALERLRKTEERLRLTQPQSPLERQPSLPVDTPLSLLAVIEISDEALDEVSSYALRALSVFPPKPNTFSEEAALSVCTATVETLDKLDDFGLLETSEPRRYTLHQTIADYARLKLTDDTAYERMVDFFIRYAETHKTNYNALDLETSNMLAALQVAFDQGLQAALLRGTNTFFHFLENRGLYVLTQVHLKRAEQAARCFDNPTDLVAALGNLGVISIKLGDYVQATKYYQEVLSLARKFGYFGVSVVSLVNLGTIAIQQGNYEQAERYSLEALELVREIEQFIGINAYEIGQLRGLSHILEHLGTVALNRGKDRQAENYYKQGLKLAHQWGDSQNICTLLQGLGGVADHRGDDKQAKAYYQESLVLARQIGYCERIINLLMNLGVLAINCRDYKQGKEYIQEGLDLAQKSGHRLLISQLFCEWGELHLRQKKIDAASEAYFKSLKVAQESEIQQAVAAALYGLARVAAEKGNPFDAFRQGQQSLSIFQGIGDRRATVVKQWLTMYERAILCLRGQLYLKQQKLDMASTIFRQILEIAKEEGIQELAAHALYGLAQVASSRGNYAEAHHQGQESLTIFEAIDHSCVPEVRQWLVGLP